jgi:hypothetical protein
MTAEVQVVLGREPTAADLSAVAEVFAAAGIPADVHGPHIPMVHAGWPVVPDPWFVEIGRGAKYLAAALAGGLLAAPGGDAWLALKRLVSKLSKTQKNPHCLVVLNDPDTNTRIKLEPDLPDEAYKQILEIESPKASVLLVLRWDQDQRQWVAAPSASLPRLLIRCHYPGCTDRATELRVRELSPTLFDGREFCHPHAAAFDLGDDRAWE